MDADAELLNDFIAESKEHLDSIEPDLLAMEKVLEKTEPEALNRVFRAIHSIKGAAGFFSFTSLRDLCHLMESVLMPIRDGEMAVSSEITDVLLTSMDVLRLMVDDVQASDEIAYQEEKGRLQAILDGQTSGGDGAFGGESTAPPHLAIEVDLKSDRARNALRRGMEICELTVFLRQDIFAFGRTPKSWFEMIRTMGEPIAIPPGFEQLAEEPGPDLSFSLLFATVLSPELLAPTMGLPAEQIRWLDTEENRKRLRSTEEKRSPLPFSLGELLIKDGLDPKHVAWALRKQKEGDTRLIGRILVEGGFTTEERVEAALRKQAEIRSREASAIDGAAEQGASDASEPARAEGPPTEEAPSAPPAAARDRKRVETTETLRVRVDLLTGLMDMAGELVLARNRLLSTLDGRESLVPELKSILQDVDHATSELQQGIMQTRMQPIGAVFSRFTRVVRDIARNLGKEIELEMVGSEVELDRSIIELLADPLTHVVRNCADHALESPDEREASGKRRTGHILLSAHQEGGQVHVEVTDDGRGIDHDKIRNKAVERGVIAPDRAARMSRREIINLIFTPGFSTAEKVSEVSGRGVGMDVVRTNIEKLGGQIDVDTEVGKGTTVLFRLPLTLAILPALIVGAGGNRYAVPQVNLVELVRFGGADSHHQLEVVQGAEVLRLRGRLLPLVRLSNVLHGKTDESDGKELTALVLRMGRYQYGVIVDQLFDGEEIVAKPLSSYLKDCRAFAGAAILGDGGVVMILDADGLAARAGLRFGDLKEASSSASRQSTGEGKADSATKRAVLVFTVAENEYFAVPQDRVLRLERISRSKIQRVGSEDYLPYRGEPLPLVHLSDHLPVGPLDDSSETLFLLVPKHSNGGTARPPRAGICVSRIVDALNIAVALEPASTSGPGVQGFGMVDGRITLFIDPTVLVEAVHPQEELVR